MRNNRIWCGSSFVRSGNNEQWEGQFSGERRIYCVVSYCFAHKPAVSEATSSSRMKGLDGWLGLEQQPERF